MDAYHQTDAMFYMGTCFTRMNVPSLITKSHRDHRVEYVELHYFDIKV
jgi:hypothetical protein